VTCSATTDMPTLTALPIPAPACVLACGAFLKNRACLVDGAQVHWSQVHGDLSDPAACVALEASVERLLASAVSPVQAVAHDLHPDFHSTRVALALADRLGVPAIAVQHHHAHVAVALAENGLRGAVVGVALDGTGLGSDGTAWGGELLWVGANAHTWRRLGHLQPLPLPGGDVAAREPWRMAAAVLHTLGRSAEIETRFAAAVSPQALRLVTRMLRQNLNCPITTSAGRWFDAAAGALGLSVRQATEAEAALALEARARRWLAEHPDFNPPWYGLDLRPVVSALFDVDRADDDAVCRAAAGFHLTLASALAHAAAEAADAHATRDVVLAGGCFMNAVLRRRLHWTLLSDGLKVHLPEAAGCGDVGLALGQAWVAAASLTAGDAWAPTEFIEMDT